MTEGLRHLVIGEGEAHLVYGNWYKTTIIGPGHRGRWMGTIGWQDAAVLVKSIAGLDLSEEVVRCPVLTPEQERELLEGGVPLEKSGEIIFSMSPEGWKPFWRHPTA